MAAKSPSTPPRSTPAAPTQSKPNPAEASERVNLQPAPVPAQTSADAIRARAYALWEQAGRPDGDGTEFWHRAEQELAANGYPNG